MEKKKKKTEKPRPTREGDVYVCSLYDYNDDKAWFKSPWGRIAQGHSGDCDTTCEYYQRRKSGCFEQYWTDNSFELAQAEFRNRLAEDAKQLTHIAGNLKTPELNVACSELVHMIDWRTVPAAKSHHHNYPGGLLAHTSEVLQIAMNMARSGQFNADEDVVIVAALFHDSGKRLEYRFNEYTQEIETTGFIKTIGHIQESYRLWNELATKSKVDNETIEKVSHCILAHHGRSDWGSPIEPSTPEAYIVHFADMLSSNCGEMK
jgi:putative nucleotidyltransferase with HDIG domain